jgi:hypothetical protein
LQIVHCPPGDLFIVGLPLFEGVEGLLDHFVEGPSLTLDLEEPEPGVEGGRDREGARRFHRDRLPSVVLRA